MTSIEIRNFLTANVKGQKFLSQMIIEEKINDKNHEIVFFVTISASPGELIKIRPNFYLQVITFKKLNYEISEKRIESLPANQESKPFTHYVEYPNGTKHKLYGDLNSFDSYPLKLISGFLWFKIPLLENETLGTTIVKTERE